MKTIIYFKIRALKNLISKYFLSSPLRSILIVCFYVLAMGVIYLSIWGGFQFISSLGELSFIIIKRLIFIIFFITFFMIALSFAILYYTSSFRSKETEFLITLPYSYWELSFYKFTESALLASWLPLGGLILFIIVYTQINNLSILIPLLSIFYLIPFILIASSLGYIFCILVLRFLDLRKVFAIIVLSVIVVLYFFPPLKEKNMNIFYIISEEIVFFKISQLWFMPFSWPGWVIVDLENGKFINSFIFLINLWTLSILSLNFIHSYGGNVFKSLFLKHSVPKHKRQYRQGFLDKLFTLKIFPLHMGSFFLKDVKLFVREPVLWLQFLIFFGLMFFYFINIRRFSYNLLGDIWKNLIAFLNTFSILCITSALSIRFIFPQWSLEGKSYWILKLSPLNIKNIYFEKFIFSLIAFLPVSLTLIYIANKMLKVTSNVFFLTIWIVFISTCSLVSFSLGWGAYFADFKREYYLKAVESLGGFINIIINFSYIVVTVFTFTFLNHLIITRNVLFFKKYIFYILGGWGILSILLSTLITYIGIRKLKNKEY